MYVGANDGMLHAFKLGKLTVSGPSISGHTKAILSGGSDLGKELWAYIPRNALPYLKYFADPNDYQHIYYVDGPTVLVDAAIANPSSCASGSDYSVCAKDEAGGTNWKTVLIGSWDWGELHVSLVTHVGAGQVAPVLKHLSLIRQTVLWGLATRHISHSILPVSILTVQELL